MRKIIGINEIPENGADFFLIDRKVIDALKYYTEKNHLMNLICWIGFKQAAIPYTKQPRIHGVSGWSFEEKINFFLDSIISFSHICLSVHHVSFGRVIRYLRIYLFSCCFLCKINRKCSIRLVIFDGSNFTYFWFSIFLTGLMGEYLWRTLEQSRSRPKYIIEKKIGVESDFKK